MIARVFIQTPFTLSVPENTTFNIYEFTRDDCRIRFFPPKVSKEKDDSLMILLDGLATAQADVIHVDFVKESFNRVKGLEMDPARDFIQQTLDFFWCGFVTLPEHPPSDQLIWQKYGGRCST